MQLALDLILVFLPLASDSSSSCAFTFVCLVNLPSGVIQTVIPEASEPFETIHLKKYYLFIFVFFTALGLHCFAWAFSNSSKWGLLFVAVHEFLIAVASLVAEHRL